MGASPSCAMRSLMVLQTDDGRTVLELIASNKVCVFISFFLKPLSVRLPLAARFTNAEWLFELTLKFFRRASAMTAKDWALPDSPSRWRGRCASSPEKFD